MLAGVAEFVGSRSADRSLRVAVDGPPASGKTTLADELAAVLGHRGRPVLRATIDDFLVPRDRRYARGELSGEGCYRDAHDHAALCRMLLDPLGPGGDRRIQLAAFDAFADQPLPSHPIVAADDALLIFDGVFLMRPELRSRWDLTVFVQTSFATTIVRAQQRERAIASQAAIARRWTKRYLPAQELYFAEARPAATADVLVNNDDFRRPSWQIRAAGQTGC
ncbi:uridine kinase [Flexivirga caeni]|nr:uridine kinase [Flexivirga caeni]